MFQKLAFCTLFLLFGFVGKSAGAEETCVDIGWGCKIEISDLIILSIKLPPHMPENRHDYVLIEAAASERNKNFYANYQGADQEFPIEGATCDAKAYWGNLKERRDDDGYIRGTRIVRFLTKLTCGEDTFIYE